jgi:hypothetical protein
MFIALGDRSPVVPDSAWVAPNATLVGSVHLAEASSVFYGAVLRADNEPIIMPRKWPGPAPAPAIVSCHRSATRSRIPASATRKTPKCEAA